jgi:hypothetical protein
MKKWICFFLLAAGAVMAVDLPHIGYVYPAGGRPGTSFEVTVGGQYLKDTLMVHVSGGDVSAEVLNYTYEIDPKAGNRIKNDMEKMKAALEEETDKTVREQLQYQIEHAEGEMMMVKMMRMDMRKNKEAAEKKQFNPQLADTVTLRVTIDEDVEPGAHELRLITTNGLSNHLMFQISDLEEAFEAEPNNEVAETKGSAPELPLVLNGQIMPGDIDCFRFYAQKGKDLVFRVQARALVPYLADAVPGWFQAVLTLYDADGNEIAYVDDFRFDPDPVLICQVPEDGEYVLEIRDSIYRGRRDFVYRIEMGELPFIDYIFPLGGEENRKVPVQLHGVNLPTDQIMVETYGNAPEIRELTVTGKHHHLSNTRAFSVDTVSSILEAEPNNLAAQAQTLPGSVVVDGRIDRPGDSDCFSFEGREGEEFSIEVQARRLDSPLDARLVLLDSEEHIVAISDDEVDRGAGLVTHHADSLIQYELPSSGQYTVRLDDLQGKGGPEYAYRLRVGPAQPDYSLRIVPSSLTIPQDGTAVIAVHALRKAGFDGEIELSIKDGPDGVELNRAVIPEGRDKVQVAIAASDREKDELMVLHIQGEARVKSRTVRRPAVPAEDMMQAFLWRHLVPAKELLVRVTEPEPVSVELDLPSEGVINVVPGQRFEIPVEKVLAQDGIKGYAQVSMSEPPAWLTKKTKGVSTHAEWNQKLVFEVGEDAPPGAFESLVLKGAITVMKDEDDPAYNPLFKWRNRTKYEFTIGAIPIQVDD